MQIFDDSTLLGHYLKIVPKNDVRTLKIGWPQLESDEPYSEANPLKYISHNIGHEAKNSLMSELVKQNLITALSTSGPVRVL